MAGKFKTEAGQTSDTCEDCPVNSNSPAASGVHDDCKADAGFTGSGVTVTACVAGTFKTSPMSSTACTDCVAGKFKIATTQTSDTCTDCDAGKFKETAAQSSDTCTDCDAGKSSAAGAACIDCTAGKTSASPFTACVAVPGADALSHKSPNNVTTDNEIFYPNGRDIVVVIMVTVAVVGVMVAGGLSVYSCCWKPEATLETKAPETSV